MWKCRNLAMWKCRILAMWKCGNQWQCGNLAMWKCGNLAMWKSGNVEMWKSGNVEICQMNVEMWKSGNVEIHSTTLPHCHIIDTRYCAQQLNSIVCLPFPLLLAIRVSLVCLVQLRFGFSSFLV